MELHHKLRRDPNWDPNSCNICGQLGHQAANCKTGNIPWRIVFGDEAFIVRKPVFWTEVLAKRQARVVDHEQLTAAAIAYAKEKAAEKDIDYEEVQRVAEASQQLDADEVLRKRREEAEAEEERARRAADPKADVPEGWNVAFDAKGKAYYWHSETNKVQWEKPTKDTPIQK